MCFDFSWLCLPFDRLPFLILSDLSWQTTVRATYEFKATSSDEIDFPKDAIITDVIKQDDDWWEGLYNDKRGFFPRWVFVDSIWLTLLNLVVSHQIVRRGAGHRGTVGRRQRRERTR
jgi:phosphatidylinositol phospholipase C gamma-1